MTLTSPTHFKTLFWGIKQAYYVLNAIPILFLYGNKTWQRKWGNVLHYNSETTEQKILRKAPQIYGISRKLTSVLNRILSLQTYSQNFKWLVQNKMIKPLKGLTLEKTWPKMQNWVLHSTVKQNKGQKCRLKTISLTGWHFLGKGVNYTCTHLAPQLRPHPITQKLKYYLMLFQPQLIPMIEHLILNWEINLPLIYEELLWVHILLPLV